MEVIAVGYDGKQLPKSKKYTPDILFLDVLIPEYDGIYDLKEIRAMNQYANVVIITAKHKQGIEDQYHTSNFF